MNDTLHNANFIAEVTLPVNGEIRTIALVFIPDYRQMLIEVDRNSVAPLSMDALMAFTQLFLTTAHALGYDSKNIHTHLDPYVHDTRYLLGIGIQKVRQAYILRDSLITWMETVRCFIKCTAKEISEID